MALSSVGVKKTDLWEFTEYVKGNDENPAANFIPSIKLNCNCDREMHNKTVANLSVIVHTSLSH